MSIILNDNIYISAGKPVEPKYLNSANDHYADIAEANASIPLAYRHKYLPVNINGVEYWYKNGVSNADLVPKSSTSSIADLTDVNLTSLSNNQFLIYDSTTTKWKNRFLVLSDIPDLSSIYLPKSGGTMTGSLFLDADPTLGMHAATKQYVDNMVVFNKTVKANVKAATTENITLSGTQTIDDVVLIAGDRVLVKNQTDKTQNGVYIVSSGAWTRATDSDAGNEIVNAFIAVEDGGTDNAKLIFTSINTAAPTLGVDDIEYTEFPVGAVYVAGDGVDISVGNVISVDSSVVRTILTYGDPTWLTSLAWSKITGTPTTLAGYGITDAYPLVGNPSNFITLSQARSGISLTTSGSSGVATYNNTTGVLNIPDYSSVLGDYVPIAGTSIMGGDITGTSDFKIGTNIGTSISEIWTGENYTLLNIQNSSVIGSSVISTIFNPVNSRYIVELIAQNATPADTRSIKIETGQPIVITGLVNYSIDYSSSYTARSLVDKEYVDGLLTASQNLSQVLTVGNDATAQDIHELANIVNYDNDLGLRRDSTEDFGRAYVTFKRLDLDDYQTEIGQSDGESGEGSILFRSNQPTTVKGMILAYASARLDDITDTNYAIPSKEWVLANAGGGSSYTYDSGLTLTGSSVNLGGELTANTRFFGPYNFVFGVDDASLINGGNVEFYSKSTDIDLPSFQQFNVSDSTGDYVSTINLNSGNSTGSNGTITISTTSAGDVSSIFLESDGITFSSNAFMLFNSSGESVLTYYNFSSFLSIGGASSVNNLSLGANDITSISTGTNLTIEAGVKFSETHKASLGLTASVFSLGFTRKSDNLTYSLVFSDSSAIFTDTLHAKGLVYAADYSSNFTAFSLVTKQYVDDAVSLTGFIPVTGTNNWNGPITSSSETNAIGGNYSGDPLAADGNGNFIVFNNEATNNFINIHSGAGSDTAYVLIKGVGATENTNFVEIGINGRDVNLNISDAGFVLTGKVLKYATDQTIAINSDAHAIPDKEWVLANVIGTGPYLFNNDTIVGDNAWIGTIYDPLVGENRLYFANLDTTLNNSRRVLSPDGSAVISTMTVDTAIPDSAAYTVYIGTALGTTTMFALNFNSITFGCLEGSFLYQTDVQITNNSLNLIATDNTAGIGGSILYSSCYIEPTRSYLATTDSYGIEASFGARIDSNERAGIVVEVPNNASFQVSAAFSGTYNLSAILDLQSTNKAFYPPRMTTTQRNAISGVSAGAVIYNTSTNKLNVRTASAWEVVTSA